MEYTATFPDLPLQGTDLVVEDNPVNQRVSQALLKRLGLQVIIRQ